MARTLKIPESVTSSAFALRLHYTHLLYAFEMKQLHDIVVPVSETPTPAMQIKRDRDCHTHSSRAAGTPHCAHSNMSTSPQHARRCSASLVF